MKNIQKAFWDAAAGEVESFLTRCCISSVSCPQAGRCACGGNRDSLLCSSRDPGKGSDQEDTRSPPHTSLCTDPRLQPAPGGEGKSSSEDRRTRSLKRPVLWGKHDLVGQGAFWGKKTQLNQTAAFA